MEGYSSNMILKCSKHKYLWSGAYIYPVARAGGCLLKVFWWCWMEEDVYCTISASNQVYSECTHYAEAGVLENYSVFDWELI